MADKSPIEWTDATWNPIVGCNIHSPGCIHCYAMAMAARIERMSKGDTHYAGTTTTIKGKARGGGAEGRTGTGKAVWTGKLALAPQHILTQPLRWSRPRRIFVNSMGDLFHEDVPDDWIDKVFAVMALCPHHTFQVLTKRADRMRQYFSAGLEPAGSTVPPSWPTSDAQFRVWMATPKVEESSAGLPPPRWPLPNVWLGVSAERQQEADERIPHLLATPAAVRFVSAEPLLGPIDFYKTSAVMPIDGHPWRNGPILQGIHWIIVGGESGRGARPMHPDWAREIRDQCADAGVAFFFKQWGEWAPGDWSFDLDDCLQFEPDDARVSVKGLNRPGADERMVWSEGERSPEGPGLLRVGKAATGRRLDGIEHNAMPAQPETEHLGTVAL